MRINLYIFEETSGFIAVSFKSVVQLWKDNHWEEFSSGDIIAEELYKNLTIALDNFFLEVQRYVGPSVQHR